LEVQCVLSAASISCSVSYEVQCVLSAASISKPGGTTGKTIHAAILFSHTCCYPLLQSHTNAPFLPNVTMPSPPTAPTFTQHLFLIPGLLPLSSRSPYFFQRRNEPKPTKNLTTKCLNVSFFLDVFFMNIWARILMNMRALCGSGALCGAISGKVPKCVPFDIRKRVDANWIVYVGQGNSMRLCRVLNACVPRTRHPENCCRVKGGGVRVNGVRIFFSRCVSLCACPAKVYEDQGPCVIGHPASGTRAFAYIATLRLPCHSC